MDLLKHAAWEQTWDLQRTEDQTRQHLDIPAPPNYTSADFVRNSYWRQRGKLDIPKERFISYPNTSPDGDDSLLLGWAGVGPPRAGASPHHPHRGALVRRRLVRFPTHTVAGRPGRGHALGPPMA